MNNKDEERRKRGIGNSLYIDDDELLNDIENIIDEYHIIYYFEVIKELKKQNLENHLHIMREGIYNEHIKEYVDSRRMFKKTLN